MSVAGFVDFELEASASHAERVRVVISCFGVYRRSCADRVAFTSSGLSTCRPSVLVVGVIWRELSQKRRRVAAISASRGRTLTADKRARCQKAPSAKGVRPESEREKNNKTISYQQQVELRRACHLEMLKYHSLGFLSVCPETPSFSF